MTTLEQTLERLRARASADAAAVRQREPVGPFAPGIAPKPPCSGCPPGPAAHPCPGCARAAALAAALAAARKAGGAA